MPEGSEWMEDMYAERIVLYGMGAGKTPPEWLTAAAFTFAFHKFLFDFLRLRRITEEDALDSDKVIALLVLDRHGEKALEHFPEKKDRYRALGVERCRHVWKIAKAGATEPRMFFALACTRVHKLSLQRRAHHRMGRLVALLEQTSLSPKELWLEHQGIGELLTELTGTDGKVGGW